ncbi:kinase-like domain-containing protein [Gymnopilus junonius]|uniref:Kinase-like domain-containing protein n=1 Tax=Gymnopilus junonius TaxID=109634 RepID=A0A9P5TM73_GYMJU|nr:kinase-like domain-containing protein [Gymnopilus junonius]
MDFIRRNTNIPVPRVLDVFKYDGMTHILQEFIDGDLLVDIWSTLDLDARQQCMQQLKGYLDELRSLSPPHPGRVEAVDGGCCLDDKIWAGGWGPFDNVDDFNNFFGYDVFCSDPIRYPQIQEPLRKIAGRKWKTVFSHGDLGPHNILWKNGRIVAIIDWECAGWLPEYWDYTRSYFGSIRFSPGWWEMFQEIAVQYPDELEVENCIPLYVTRLF